MTKRLKELGIPVVSVKTTDEDISRTERLKRANEAFNGDPNAILISNHINSGGLGCPCLGSRFKLGY